MQILLFATFFPFALQLFAQDVSLDFAITQDQWTEASALQNGRLFLAFSKAKPATVFDAIQYPDLRMDPVFGADVSDWKIGEVLRVKGEEFYGFPLKKIADLSKGKWHVHAVFKPMDFRTPAEAHEKIYSEPVAITVGETSERQTIQLSLNKKGDRPKPPENETHFLYETVESPLLSDFWKQPMSISYQLVLPKSYHSRPEQRYPLLVMVGGFGARYYHKVISEKKLFDPSTPEMIIVLLDSKAPFGDSYQTNSANNGPYGDAVVTEVIPQIEANHRCIGTSASRFLTGTSTGGWASLALQIFYPDFFNGVWSTCADPVDFRQMELINLYEDESAFVNRHAVERPGMRDINGEPRYTLRTELWAENVLGLDNSYHLSGGQWGSWNAVFGPRDDATGLPMPIFDPETGKINKEVAKAWQQYDLRMHLEENWDSIGTKLQGKLHIWMGTMDSYYLNNAMVLLDRFLKSTTNPVSDADLHFICGEGHSCDSEIPLELMMKQMLDRYEKTK
ncbi:MAG: alpha/beta hydrolase-fold protein [Bacteroidota bacterium]